MLFAALRAAALPSLLAAAIAYGACASDNAAYCRDDSVCATRRQQDPTVGPLCHHIGHFCGEACSGNDFCADETRLGYSPSTPICNASGHCEGRATDGGPDKRELGDRCSDKSECKSNVCEGGFCCNATCGGACRTCSSGNCETVKPGDACIDLTKQDVCSSTEGHVIEWRCDAQAVCKAREVFCSGYLCASAGGKPACAISCGGNADCSGVFQCEGKSCKGELALGGVCNDNDKLCSSGNCTDGVCCDQATCGPCAVCNSDGRGCKNLPAGDAPPGSCPGVTECGGGKCDGAGQCDYTPAGSNCGATQCASSGTSRLLQDSCDGSGVCTPQAKSTPCGFFVCQGSACKTGCATHADCIGGSACDRSTAHLSASGMGVCLDPTDVGVVLAGQSLAQTVSALGTRTTIRAPAKTYNEALNLSGVKVRIIADGDVVIAAPAGVGVQATAGADVQLQGVTISAGSGGVLCAGASKLVLIDSTIRGTSGLGVEGSNCDATLRRNTVLENRGGGISLTDGQIVVVNNVVAGNGNLNVSPVGGIKITRTAGAVTLHNNTVADNVAQAALGAGVHCSGSVTLESSIVWGNATLQQQGCTFNNSIVQGGVAGGANNESADPLFVSILTRDYRVPMGSPAVDRGDVNAATANVGTIDRAGAVRIQGGRIDRGAYETK